VHHITVDSCHSRWDFDTEHLRYRRVPKAASHLDLSMAPWHPYHELHLDPCSDAFYVVLNAEGTRMLRSWRHLEGICPQCGDTGTGELALHDLVHSRSD
jgi:hypothetical protein